MKSSSKTFIIVVVLALTTVAVFGYITWTTFGSAVWNKTLKTNPDLENGLVGHWTFDGPDTINNIVDKSGQGNTGYLDFGASGNTATTSTPGKIGQTMEFDGTDDYVNINDDNSLSSTDITLCAWIKGGGTNQIDLYKGSNSSNIE